MNLYERVVDLQEASEIAIRDLPKAQQAVVKALSMLKPEIAFEGVHGYIITFDSKQAFGGFRLSKDTLKILMRIPVLRWIEGKDDQLSVGC